MSTASYLCALIEYFSVKLAAGINQSEKHDRKLTHAPEKVAHKYVKDHAHKLEKSIARERRVTHTRAQSQPHKSERSCRRAPKKVVHKIVKDHVHKLKKSHAQE